MACGIAHNGSLHPPISTTVIQIQVLINVHLSALNRLHKMLIHVLMVKFTHAPFEAAPWFFFQMISLGRYPGGQYKNELWDYHRVTSLLAITFICCVGFKRNRA